MCAGDRIGGPEVAKQDDGWEPASAPLSTVWPAESRCGGRIHSPSRWDRATRRRGWRDGCQPRRARPHGVSRPDRRVRVPRV